MTSRSRKRYAAGLAVVAALALSGCTMHPGSAAVVNGDNISQSHIDNLVLAACSYQEAGRKQQGGAKPSTSMAYLRHVFVQDLISFQISNKAANQMGLTVSPAAIAKVTSSQKIPPGLSSSDQKLLTQFFYDSAKAQLQQATIGAHIKDPSVTNADNVSSADITAAQKYLTAFTAKQSVTVSPANGSWNGQTVQAGNGSLSAPASTVAKRWEQLEQNNAQNVTGLPPSQVCG